MPAARAARRQLAGEQRAEPAALERVADDDREFGGVGRVGHAHAAGDRDDRLGVVAGKAASAMWSWPSTSVR